MEIIDNKNDNESYINVGNKNQSFILTTNENGEDNYKITEKHQPRVLSIRSERNKVILRDLYIIKENKYDNKLINFSHIDLNIINFKYIDSKNYNDKDNGFLTHTNSKIISILVKTNPSYESLSESMNIVINIFKKMETDDRIKMISVSKRNGDKNKSNKTNKFIINFNYLIKIFFSQSYSKDELKVLFNNIINKYEIKIKVSDKSINKNDINEKGVKKSNWQKLF